MSVDALALMQHLIGVLDEGRRTATYKLATLLAIIDCAAAGTDCAGRAGSVIPTRDLAQRVVELYWPQTRPFGSGPGRRGVLRQSSQPRAVTIDAVVELREQAESAGLTTLAGVQRAMPRQWSRCLDQVELNLVRMPLGRLQRPAGWTEQSSVPYPRFLYPDDRFREDMTAGRLRAEPAAVELFDGVADVLVSMSGLLRPLLELQWTRDVARLNRHDLGEDRLREFLFGSRRIGLQQVVTPLREVQQGRCFYCHAALSGEVEVDHFIPWSLVPNDALANLVLADGRCNGAKRDNLAGLRHLEQWAQRSDEVLRFTAEDLGLAYDRTRSMLLARGMYAHAREGTMLWVSPGAFEVLDRGRLERLLPRLGES